MSFSPQVFLIGAQKAGTTTLASLLSQHPDICLAKTKEPHYFTGNSHRSSAWYQAQFPNYQNAICIDASTSYSFAPLSLENSYQSKKCFHNIPQRIHALNPNAKFIYLLREPIKRTYSSYWHSFNTGREYRSFPDAIKKDFFYVDVSNYYGQLALWLEYFSLDSFLFVLFEDMKNNPQPLVQKCFNFLGIGSNEIQINLQQHRNKTQNVNYAGRQFNRIFKELDYSGFGFIAPSKVRKFINTYTVDSHKIIPDISEAESNYLQEYFYEKNRDLARLTGLSLSQWQL